MTTYIAADEYLDPANIQAPHEVDDPDKVEALSADMSANGWLGAPLLVTPGYVRAWNGTHRLAAAQAAGIDVPVVYSVDHEDADPEMYRDDDERLDALRELGDERAAAIMAAEVEGNQTV